MTKPAHHKLDIYGTELHFAATPQAWAILRRMNPNLDPAKHLGYGATYDSHERDTDQHHAWVWIDKAKHAGPLDLANTVAHEATHVALDITDRHAIDPTSGNGEPLAYLVGWLTEWMTRHL